MAFDATTATVAGWLAIGPVSGLPLQNYVPSPLQAACAAAAQANIPAGAPTDFVVACTAALIARGMFYWKNTPGDCGSGTTITPSTGAAEELGTSGTAAVAGISAMAGAALPGAGSFISAIVGIFGANHAAAVAKEQSTLCGIMPIVNQLIAYCDNLVKTGQVSASDAVAGLQSAFSQINEQLATIEQPCNAACVYEGQFKAHAAFAAVYYPAIAPPSILPLAPGSAPAALVDAPGDVLTEAGAEVASITLGSSASGLSSTDYLAIGGILLAVIIFGIAAVL